MRDANSRTQEMRWDVELFLFVWEGLAFLPSFFFNSFFKVSLGRAKDKGKFMQYSNDIIQSKKVGYSDTGRKQPHINEKWTHPIVDITDNSKHIAI